MIVYSYDDLPHEDIVSETSHITKDDLLNINKQKAQAQADIVKSSMSSLNKEALESKKSLEECQADQDEYKLRLKNFVSESIEKAEALWREKLLKNDVKEDEHIPVCRLSMEDYYVCDEMFPTNCYYENKTVFMRMPISPYHSFVVSAFQFYLCSILDINTATISSGTDTKISDEKIKVPDIGIYPVERTSTIPTYKDYVYPSVAIEIAYHNESIDMLKKEVTNWVTSDWNDVAISIGIKIAEHENGYSLTLYILRRGDITMEEFEFGVVDKRGTLIKKISPSKIALPIALVFDRAPIPEEYKRKRNVYIDLKELSQLMLEFLRRAERQINLKKMGLSS